MAWMSDPGDNESAPIRQVRNRAVGPNWDLIRARLKPRRTVGSCTHHQPTEKTTWSLEAHMQTRKVLSSACERVVFLRCCFFWKGAEIKNTYIQHELCVVRRLHADVAGTIHLWASGWTPSHQISVQHFVNMEFRSPTCRWSIYPWIIKKIQWYNMICKTDSKPCAPKCSERSAALPDKTRANEKNLGELLTKHRLRPRGYSNNWMIISIS